MQAWRQLKNNPLFAFVAISLIAIGVGANTAIFTLVDAVLMRRLPVRDPQELLHVVDRRPPLPDSSYFTLEYGRLLREKSTSFSDAILQAEFFKPVVADGLTEFVRVSGVSPNFFDMLGVHATLGRVFSEREPKHPVAVLSDRYWRSRFSGDPRVMGKAIQIDGAGYTIIGVTAPEFHGTTVELNPDIRIPAAGNENDLVARLRPGVSLERALAEARSLYAASVEDWARRNPTRNRSDAELNGEMRLIPIDRGVSVLRDQFSGSLQVLMAGVALVLLMVCSNVAGLLLERVAARDREIAIRLALGAPRRRLFLQWMSESALLAVLGGIGGIVLARALLPVIGALIPPLRNRSGELLALDPAFTLNWRVLLFSIGTCAVAAVLAGVSPALRAGRLELQEALRSARSGTAGLRRIEAGLTTFQIAMCTLLLIVAGMFVETLNGLRSMNPGFDRDHVIAMTIQADRLEKDAKPNWDGMLGAVRELPQVQKAAYAHLGLMRGTGMKTSAGLPGEKVPPSEFMNSSLNDVSPEYFDTMGIRILAGRTFGRTLDAETAIVNQAFVRHFFQNADPIGKRFGTGSGVLKGSQVIIGVVSDARYRSLREPIPPTIYGNLMADDWKRILHIRANGNPSDLVGPVRELVGRLLPGLTIREVNLLNDEVERSLWKERLVAQLATAFAVIAALLAAIGLYGTLAYYVSRNMRDIAIRIAIGAPSLKIVRLLGGRVAVLVVLGVVAGVGAALIVSPWVRPILYADPSFTGIVAGVGGVLLVASVASMIPAVRALRIDPVIALREE